MKKLIYTAIAGIGLLGSMSSAMADDHVDFSSLARDVTALSLGIEAINPFFILRDTNMPIPVKSATHSISFRPPVPFESGHFVGA